MTNKNNKIFWDKFYKKKLNLVKPSSFAKFILKFLINKKKSIIIDVGCGNGRDLLFFKKHKIDFIGIDSSKSAISSIKKKLKTKKEKNRIFQSDFVKYNYEKKIKKIFSIYSRFTWHTIDLKNEKIFLDKISKLKNLEYLFIETRSNKDSLCGKGLKVGKNEFITDHYRRFINKKEIIKKLEKNFSIKFIKESTGFSKFNNEDPCLIRIIAKRKLTKIS